MYLLLIFLAITFVLAFGMGFRRIFRLQHLNKRRIINGFLGAIIVLTLLSIGQWLELLSPNVAAQFTMLLYCLTAGFFCGFATKMIVLRRNVKAIEYVYRSFWTEAAPTFISILIILLGIYRTGLVNFDPYSGIGITSGLSLLGLGFLGLTIKIVPEFRRKGILILDQFVPWKSVIAYHWQSDDVLQIDYYTNRKKLTDFTTYIPPEDQLLIERLLGKKLKEHEDERKQTIEQENE